MNALKGRLLLVVLLMGLSGIMTAECSDSDGTSGLKENPVRKIDIIGYYGNSGNALSSIPLITDIPDEYNILIMTFANFPSIGIPIEFDIQGPYAGKYGFPSKAKQLIADIGGSQDEYFTHHGSCSIAKTADGGFILVGDSDSKVEDLTANKGLFDMWARPSLSL